MEPTNYGSDFLSLCPLLSFTELPSAVLSNLFAYEFLSNYLSPNGTYLYAFNWYKSCNFNLPISCTAHLRAWVIGFCHLMADRGLWFSVTVHLSASRDTATLHIVSPEEITIENSKYGFYSVCIISMLSYPCWPNCVSGFSHWKWQRGLIWEARFLFRSRLASATTCIVARIPWSQCRSVWGFEDSWKHLYQEGLKIVGSWAEGREHLG